MGARTPGVEPEWKYLGTRRLAIYLEQSIEAGLPWVVFEPNHEPPWQRVRSMIDNFLNREWQQGALFYSTAQEAYFARCDRSTMTQTDLDNGRLICLVGIAPLKPSEFVIFQIDLQMLNSAQ